MDNTKPIFDYIACLLLFIVLVSCTKTKKEFSHPGATMSVTMQAKLKQALLDKKPGYTPRTKHFVKGVPKYINRLIEETSPYLLQHAHNPVNWYGWGEEAFAEAKRLNRPVFMSIGYATCHWCHVMEEESFEDEEIAQYMNENYVNIKVDREERPDIDAIYMAAVQAISGRGGWPMSVWLDHDRAPFYGGTYFPPRDGDRGSRMGFLTILDQISAHYKNNPSQIRSAALELTKAIEASLSSDSAGDVPEENALENAYDYYVRRYDPVYGGLSGAPKFPSSLSVRVLLRHYRKTGNLKSLNMATNTLDKMAQGGMYDQIGGGFHRYSVDDKWLVPHFEKMLYDNALLVPGYLEAYQVTNNLFYKQIAEETLAYVERDMMSAEGGFYSATDADSLTPSGNREEGYYYTWTKGELANALGKSDAKYVERLYGLDLGANFEGRNLLFTSESVLSDDRLRAIRKKLLAERSERPKPLRDEKIITAWNGLMISAFAKAALVLQNEKYAKVASHAATFVEKKLLSGEKLLRTFKDGRAKHRGYLEDYAFYIAALLDLFEATQNTQWLSLAIKLDSDLQANYEDNVNGGYFMTANNAENLLVREKPGYDGAEPSGNSVAALNLFRLSSMTTDHRYKVRGEKILKVFSKVLTRRPAALSEMLLALDYHHDLPKEIVLVGNGKAEIDPFQKIISEMFLPNKVLTVLESENQDLNKLIPFTKWKIRQNEKATAYVCEAGVCKFPTNEINVFREQLK